MHANNIQDIVMEYQWLGPAFDFSEVTALVYKLCARVKAAMERGTFDTLCVELGALTEDGKVVSSSAKDVKGKPTEVIWLYPLLCDIRALVSQQERASELNWSQIMAGDLEGVPDQAKQGFMKGLQRFIDTRAAKGIESPKAQAFLEQIKTGSGVSEKVEKYLSAPKFDPAKQTWPEYQADRAAS